MFNSNIFRDIDVIVIGAGVSGVFAALELAKKYKVLILEQESNAIPRGSTSYNQCYKLHSGVHYFGDPLTARKCLLDSIECAKTWPEHLLGLPNSKARRNRHYIMSNSLFDKSEAQKVAAMLKLTYKTEVEKDPTNKVFGEPENFIQEITTADEYPYVAQSMDFRQKDGSIQKAQVEMAFDVGEPQVDIHRMQNNLKKRIEQHPNITSLFQHKVVQIKPTEKKFGYDITVVNRSGEKTTFFSKGIVNCAWQNIEILNATAGLSNTTEDKLLIRMKISILAKLPNELQNIDTCIFSLGPYCSITNQFNGTAVLTYEPITNIDQYLQGEEPSDKIRFIQELQKDGVIPLETELGQQLAKDIITGCSIYVPKINTAEALEVRAGYVKMYMEPHEKYSIYKKESPIHRRREDGIFVHPGNASCFISAAAMKMTYASSNATKIYKFMLQQMENRSRWLAQIANPEQKRKLNEAAISTNHSVRQLLQNLLQENQDLPLNLSILMIKECIIATLEQFLPIIKEQYDLQNDTLAIYAKANKKVLRSLQPTLYYDQQKQCFFTQKPQDTKDNLHDLPPQPSL
jgi:hypothetical protein